MAIEHVNRRGTTYYLHVGKTKTGKPKYHFSTKREGTLTDTIPEGYEVYENPNAQVFLRKVKPKLVTDLEVAIVERGMRDYSAARHFLIDVQDKNIVVYVAESNELLEERTFAIFGLKSSPALSKTLERFLHYTAMMRFTLVDEESRRFSVERWCFKGAIDGWIPLYFCPKGQDGDLRKLVAAYCRHLGRESFYELM